MKIFFKIICLFLFTGSVYSQQVFKTPSGQKYHLGTCRMVKNVSEELTLNAAVKLGLGPCKICNPPQTSTKSVSAHQQAKGESNTVQCKGTTKKGTRCKHRTSIANGYCFQHDPEK